MQNSNGSICLPTAWTQARQKNESLMRLSVPYDLDLSCHHVGEDPISNCGYAPVVV